MYKIIIYINILYKYANLVGLIDYFEDDISLFQYISFVIGLSMTYQVNKLSQLWLYIDQAASSYHVA